MNRLLKTIYLGLSVSFALIVFSLFSFANLSTSMSARAAANDATEQTTTVNTQASSDAIAIRVFANDEHLSARDWFYQNISTKRSLQSLTVDGYDAVRDNRTVYVAASNVVGCNGFGQGGGDCLKPIIAVISFNQNISTETVDIFGQILNNWKFNHNLNNRPKTCSNNITICRDNSECHSGGDICSTAKEKVIRDTKRLIILASIKTKLEDYRLKFQHYPSFEAGSYLPNKTLSVWPSWQKTFATKLGSALPVDPINKLGSCPGDGVNQTTCWNERTKRFYNDQGLEDLPDYSHVIRYEFNNSNDYNLCALFETTYPNILDSQNSCQTNYRNTGPVISCRNIVGLPNKPFTGYAEVFDNEGDLITSATINPTTLAGWDPITVSITPDRRYVKIISNRAGAINRYNVDITVKDTLNNQSTVS
ncbi:MAG TPA: hypothetical protein PLT32_01485, partial [bacterium]|nr:hypothetical protein [bacterium]